MSTEEKECLRLGQHVLRMIRDLTAIRGNDVGYTRQEVTFRNGSLELIVATKEVADVLDRHLRDAFDVETAAPPSEVN